MRFSHLEMVYKKIKKERKRNYGKEKNTSVHVLQQTLCSHYENSVCFLFFFYLLLVAMAAVSEARLC